MRRRHGEPPGARSRVTSGLRLRRRGVYAHRPRAPRRRQCAVGPRAREAPIVPGSFRRSRRFAATGKLDQALVEYEVAIELNPSDPDIDKELRNTRTELRAKVAIDRQGKSELQTVVERARAAASSWPRPPRRQNAGVAHVPGRRQPRRLHVDWPLRECQRRLRHDVPRLARHGGPAERHALRRADGRGRPDADVLPRHLRAIDSRDSGYADQASRVPKKKLSRHFL